MFKKYFIYILATAFTFTIFSSLIAGTVSYAKPSDETTTCGDGQEAVVKPSYGGDKTKLDGEDYKVACKGHNGTMTAEQCAQKFHNTTDISKYEKSKCDGTPGTGCVVEDNLRASGKIIDCKNEIGTKQADTTVPGKCAGVETNIITCKSDEKNPIMNILVQFINFLAIGVGIAVAAGITWGGFVYTQANGNSSKAQEGITIITNSVIGLILYIFMYALVNFLVPGGLFNA